MENKAATENNKKDLIVTLTDANFVAQAKQLFASVYFNSGWQGDYMIIVSGLSPEDAAWFSDRGIIVYDKPLLSDTPAGAKNYPPIILSKFYLFQTEFKKWRKVVFFDADIIVRASLDGLLSLNGFNAPTATLFKLRDEFIPDSEATKAVRKIYDFKKDAFCVGVFAFDTDIIEPETFSRLLDFYSRFKNISNYGDESIMNLVFYEKWNKLSLIYNTIPWYIQEFLRIKEKRMLACAFHFPTARKPWDSASPYYNEWTENLRRAEEIDLNNRPAPKQVFSEREIKEYDNLIKFRQAIYPLMSFLFSVWRQVCSFFGWLNSLVGRVGLFIKKRNPKLYNIIKFKK